MAAIRAKKFGTKTAFGNLEIAREWNWCSEQCEYLLKFLNKKPQDFILSNGKLFSELNKQRLINIKNLSEVISRINNIIFFS